MKIKWKKLLGFSMFLVPLVYGFSRAVDVAGLERVLSGIGLAVGIVVYIFAALLLIFSDLDL